MARIKRQHKNQYNINGFIKYSKSQNEEDRENNYDQDNKYGGRNPYGDSNPTQDYNLEYNGNDQLPHVGVEEVENGVESIGDGNSGLFEINDNNRGKVILYVFIGVVGAYLIISLVIYIASFFIKSKNDEIAEEFMKQINKQNQFYMDPKFGKSPMVNTNEMEEKHKYNENDDIWENYIVTGKKDDIGINNMKKNDDYPITAPVSPSPLMPSPMMPSPLQKTYASDKLLVPKKENGINIQKGLNIRKSFNENYKENGINLSSEPINYISRASNSTSSSTASIAHLIPKHKKSTEESFQNVSGSPHINQVSRPRFYSSPVQGSPSLSPNLDMQIPKIPSKPTPILRSNSPNQRSPIDYQGSQGGFPNPMNSRSQSPPSSNQTNPNYQVNYNQLGYGQNQLNRNALNFNLKN